MNQEEKILLHVAVMLYNSKSQNIKEEGVLKKVIESILVINGNKPLTCTEISVEIDKNVHMIIVEDEIKGIVTNTKNKNFALDYVQDDILVRLKQERYEYIMNKNERNIESYIKEFTQLKGYTEDTISLLERYLYHFYSTNVNEFGNLIGETDKVSHNVEDFTLEENRIIQEFIDWDNPEKNEMLIAIADYALEYLLVAGNNKLKDKKNIKAVFSNKKLYIDTNILFYCMGINGSVYEEANRAFLKKCRDCNEHLYISYYTDKELKDTVKHFISEIERLASPLLHNRKVSGYVSNQDVYKYYLTWAKTQKVLTDAKYFKSFLLEKYENLINEYNIQVEHAEPFSEEVLQKDEKYRKYNEEIFSKSGTSFDAKNVYFIESKRTPAEVNLQSANTVFISADKQLQKWDAERNRETAAIVVAPNL